MPPATLAADLGGTTIKLGVVADGRVLAFERHPAQAAGGLAARLPELARSWQRLLEGAGSPDVGGVGLALPCLLSRDRRRVLSTVDKYPDVMGLDLDTWARETWGVPVTFEGDAVAALLGEHARGAARTCEDAAMLTFGTGIGSAVLIGGRPFRGAHGAGGVLMGHQTVRLDGDLCLCGNVGCVETEASTWALRRRHGPHADLEWLFAGGAPDAGRLALRDHVLDAWAAALVGVVHAFDPGCVVLGGGAMASAARILPRLAAAVRARAWRPASLPPLPIVAGTLGDRAALVGLDAAVRTLA